MNTGVTEVDLDTVVTDQRKGGLQENTLSRATKVRPV